MTGTEEKALYIGQRCVKAGMTIAGAAGVLSNVQAESVFKSTNLEDAYETRLGMNDAEYTAAVDSGRYQNFTQDQAGYGLCQWTAQDRKQGMMKFHRSRNASIGDFQTQVEWLLQEIKGYSYAWRTCSTSHDPGECGYAVCKYYEIPANTENEANRRRSAAQQWFSFLQENIEKETPVQPAPEPKPQEEQTQKTEFWPPRMLAKGMLGPDVVFVQACLGCRGYNTLTDGIFSTGLEKKVVAFQKTAFPDQPQEWDGIVGPKTLRKMIELF